MGCAALKLEQLTCLFLTTFLIQRIESSHQLQHISRQLRLRALGVMEEPIQQSSTAGMLPMHESLSMLLLSWCLILTLNMLKI